MSRFTELEYRSSIDPDRAVAHTLQSVTTVAHEKGVAARAIIDPRARDLEPFEVLVTNDGKVHHTTQPFVEGDEPTTRVVGNRAVLR